MLGARYIADLNGDGDILDVGEYYPGDHASGSPSDYTNELVLGDYVWFSGNSGSNSHSVGQKLPNALGLFDISGNVAEWTGHEQPAESDTLSPGMTVPTLGGRANSNAYTTVVGQMAGQGPYGSGHYLLGFRIATHR